MRFFTALIFVLLITVIETVAQKRVDSLVSSLNDKNLVLLNTRLFTLLSRDFLVDTDPDQKHWPALISTIANKTIAKSEPFSNEAKALVEANVAAEYVREGLVTEGYPHARMAIRKSRAMTDQTRAYVYCRYSDILGFLNLLDSSIFYSEKALDISHLIKNDSLEKAALDQLAFLSYRSKNFPKSEAYFKELCRHPLSTNRNRMDYYNTIGLTFRNRAFYDSSDFWYRRALPIAVSLKDTAWIGLLHGNIGYNQYLDHKIDKALPDLLMDLKYSFSKHSYSSGMNALCTITEIYITKKDKKQSRLFYDSLTRSLVLDHTPGIKLKFYKISSNYFEANGDLTKALLFSRLSLKLDDSIQAMQNVAKAADLQAQFDFNRQAQKIEDLELQGAAQFATNRQQNFLLIGTFIFIVLGIGFTYVLYRSNQFKLRTNQLLQEQNSKISQQANYLNQLNDTKDKLFSIISHDLRGPINSLKQLMNMVHKKMISPEEFNHFLGQLQHNVEHVHFTLDNLLQWSRSQLQGIQTRPVETRLSLLAKESLDLFDEQINSKGLKADNTISNEVVVLADPDQIRLVFRNLISNAIKFTSNDGKIYICSQNDGPHETIMIEDSGIGIAPDIIERLFNDSSSVTTAGTDGEKGTGIGLILCKEMIERNGGSIRVKSKPGDGTKFIFTLPKA